MTDFSHLNRLEVKEDSTVEFDFHELDTCPVLIVRSTVGNDAYQARIRTERDSLERKLKAKSKRGRKRRNVSSEIFKLLRGPDRKHYPGSIVVGWNTNKDSNGDEAEYSDETCTEFLTALPDWLFDRLRNFVIDPNNFVDIPMTLDDEEDLAGN